MDDIVKTKKKTIEEKEKATDMLSQLAAERKKNSIPNNFQEQYSKKTKIESDDDVTKIEIHTDSNPESQEEQIEEPKQSKPKLKIVDTTVNDKKYDLDYDTFGGSKKKKRSKAGKYLFFGFVFLAIIFFGLNFFKNVKIFITPKVEKFVFENEKFTANKTSTDGLSFEVMIVEAKEEKDVSFSETKDLTTKAKGTVVLYNEYSTKSQKLLINTRLSDDNGLIYMTDKAVTIPGFTRSGSNVVPGSVTVNVTAQNSGDKYNSTLKDFKIVGFKGTSKYDQMYARAKTDFSGGASGDFYIPTDTEKGEINSDMEIRLKNALNKKIEAEIPEGYIAYPESMQFSFVLNQDSLISKEKDTKIDATGMTATVIFKEDVLTKEIVKKAYPQAGELDFEEIIIPEIKDMKFAFSNKDYLITKDTNSISFNLSGEATLSWQPNLENLKNKLIGISKGELDLIFSEDPGIDKVRVLFRPPWQKNVPDDLKKIKIIEEISVE